MNEFRYPEASRLGLTEDIGGHQVSDPYRWMEDDTSAERAGWLAAQTDLFGSYREELPGRDRLAARVRELLGTGYVGTPAWRGERRFYTRRDPGAEHGVLVTRLGEDPEQVLVDPMAIDPSGLTTLDAWQPDKEGRQLVYQLSEGGDEESLLRVIDVTTGSLADGPIDRCRYSNVAWLPGGKAFYYTRRLPPEVLPEGESQYHRRVYLHQVGAPTDEDVLVFGEGRDKTDYYGVSVSRDGRWLVISASRGTAPRNDLWIADLSESDPATPELKVIQEGIDAQTSIRVGRDGRLYVFTDLGAPRGRIAVTDPADSRGPTPATWRDLIGEDPEAVLSGYAILDGAELDRPVLLAEWTRHAVSEISVHDLATGERVGLVPLPGPGTVGAISERPEGGHEAWFSYTDFATPATVYRYDARTGEMTVWSSPPGKVQVPAVQAKQVTYRSADGAHVRMIVTWMKESSAGQPQPSPGEPGSAATRPTILYGYGGFGLSLTPAYSASILALVEAGAVYAVAGLRGGGEEGEEWHRAGMLDRKHNCFDDFHAAAHKLFADGWTTEKQLAISGGSNGGLLVGVSITQRPELYAAGACSAPLLDMVRYERFGLGQTWNVEYGSAEDPEQLGWLVSYSPYHHVRDDVSYPATLFTVFESDTRVDPMHARKMCAALQHATASSLPILIRSESQAGHGQRSISRAVAVSADTLAFLARFTGLDLASAEVSQAGPRPARPPH